MTMRNSDDRSTDQWLSDTAARMETAQRNTGTMQQKTIGLKDGDCLTITEDYRGRVSVVRINDRRKMVARAEL